MKATECEGIPPEDCDFLNHLEKCFQSYPDRRVAARFAVAYSKKRLAGMEPGDLMRYRKAGLGKGFTAEVRPKAEIVASAPAGDPCCEWDWDPDLQQLVCVAWC